jgi:branched-chain amino acid transport system substrate-binding protein
MRILPILLAALALAGCSGPATPPPVLVGHVADQGRPDSPGASAARGIRLAVMEANKDPDKGVGRQVKVLHTDTLGKLEAFEAEGVRLASVNRVAALLGGDTLEEVERLERARVPVLSPTGVRPRSHNNAVFSTGLSPEQRGKVLARWVAEVEPLRVLVLADESRPEAVRVADSFARELPLAEKKADKAANPPAALAVVRFGKEVSLEEAARRLEREKSSLILFAGALADLKKLRTDAKADREKTWSILFDGEDARRLQRLQESGTLEGTFYLATPFAPDADSPRVKEFVKAYTAAFNEPPDAHAAVAYDNARLLFEALRQTKDNLTGPRLRDALAALKDFPGVTGSLSFAEDRSLRRPAFVVRVAGGQATAVKSYPPGE